MFATRAYHSCIGNSNSAPNDQSVVMNNSWGGDTILSAPAYSWHLRETELSVRAERLARGRIKDGAANICWIFTRIYALDHSL